MTVSSSTNRVSYAGNGSTTVFPYTYKVFDEDDLTVILRSADGTETVKTITSDYTVSGVGNAGGGNVTMLTAPATGETLVILREQDLVQELDIVPNDPFPADSLEGALDRLTFMVQQHEETLGRTIKASRTNTISGSEFTISAADRASKIFAFDSSGDLSIAQELGTYRGDWATGTAYAERDIVKDGGNDNLYFCNTAHTSSGSVPISTNTDAAKWDLLLDVSAFSDLYDQFDVRYLGSKSSDPATDNQGNALIDGALYWNTTDNRMKVYDLGNTTWALTAPTAAEQVNIDAVAAIAADVSTVAGIDTDVTAVAADATDIGTVSASIAGVNTVAGISANVTTVAGISANVTTVAGISSDVTAVAPVAADVTAVAAIDSDVTTVAGISSDVTTVATNVADITNFSDVYLGPKASDPATRNDSSALQAGDLYFNTTSDTMRVYTGSAWEATAVSTSGLVEKTSATGSAIVPSGTDAQRDGTPSAGYFRFNTDSDTFEGYDGTAWGAIGGGGVDLSAVDQDIIPDADSTRDIGSTSNRWAQGWFDDVTLTNLNGNPIATAGSLSSRNKILNGAMQIAQRGTNFAGGTTNADDAYTLDRWYVLSEGSDSIDVDQIADSPDDGGKCIRLDVETTGEKFGIAQIVEAVNCTDLIGNTVTLSFAAKVSNARIDTVKAAVVAWSGTADTVTSDIISAWNADGTTPTLIANATFENTPADLGVTTSWATYEITANVDTASTANLIVFIWSDDATNPLAGDFLYLTNVQLELGDTATPFEHRSYGQELALCQRYYMRWQPKVNSGATSFPAVGFGYASATGTAGYNVSLPSSMRATPTVSFSGTINAFHGAASATLSSVGTVYEVSNSGFWITTTMTTSPFTVGDAGILYIQNSTANYFEASAEL